MNTANRKLISRGLDAELSGKDRDKLEALLASDAEAKKTSTDWELFGDAMRLEARNAPAPDATLAWQDIRRVIRQQESAPAAEGTGWLLGRMRWAGAIASTLVLGALAWSVWQLVVRPEQGGLASFSPANRVEWVIAELPGATTMIYTDVETELTVIWMDVAQTADPRDS
jgi:anti-sigma factor RsiW